MAYTTEEEPERAILVGIDRGNPEWPLSESLAELGRLAETAGCIVVGEESQRLEKPNPRTFVGSGKADELGTMAAALDADVVIFDDELSPSQQANLEKVFKGRKVIDRTALILDIFALHATTREGRLQVRLAQNQYLLPRLRGMWAHLASNRMGGGVGSRFGEGESQLEVDRRIVRKRITSITRELEHVSSSRQLQRKSRGEGTVFRIALAGYTNAGKSSLLNRLTDADVLVFDKLFATLDSTTRKIELPHGREATITDTVGFIQKLPTGLVEAFKSTLEEITEADLILQVTDASSPQRTSQDLAVRDVLEQIGAAAIPAITVFNKCDLLEEGERKALSARYPAAVLVSALSGEGLDELVSRIADAAEAGSTRMHVLIPFSRGDLVVFAHEHCSVLAESYSDNGTLLYLLVPNAHASRFADFVHDDDPQASREDTVPREPDSAEQ